MDAAAEVLKSKAITVVSINCTAEVNLCNSYNVTSYPALRVFRGSENVTRFREKRKSKACVILEPFTVIITSDCGSIISYMLKQIIPIVSTVTEENLEELRLIDLPLALAFINQDDQASRELLTSIAGKYKDQILFGISFDAALAKSNSESFELPFIVLYSASDHIDRVLSGPFDSQSIGNFLGGVSNPLIGKFSMETYYTYTQVSVQLTVLLRIPESKAVQAHLHLTVRATSTSHLRRNRL